MNKKLVLSLLTVFAGALSLSAQDYTYNFDGTDSYAWVDGASLNNVNSNGNILAQNSWVIDDIDGNGTLHAFTNGDYQKAVFFGQNTDTFDVGDTVTLNTRVRLANLSAFTGYKSMLRIGLKGDFTNGTTEVGLELAANGNANQFFKLMEAGKTIRTDLTTTDESFHDLSIAITKSATTADTFNVSGSWDGGSAINYTIVNASLYADNSVFAVLDSRLNSASGTTGIWIDSFSASTVPEPSTFASIFGLMALAFVVSRRKRD